MKILSSSLNTDGHFDVLVEYQKTVTVRETATIPNRTFMANQPGADPKLATTTDADYLAQAVEQLRARCEDPAPVPADQAALAANLVGQVITK